MCGAVARQKCSAASVPSCSVTYDPGRRTRRPDRVRPVAGRVPCCDEWREPLRAQRDPIAEGLPGRVRSNRDEHRRARKQTWHGRFISTYGWASLRTAGGCSR
jgi:hypothetical protein